MKRRHHTITAAALAVLAATAQAQTTVSLSGIADGGYYRRELAGEAVTKAVQGGLMSMSRWDMRGTEDLGGGLAATFELSSHFRLDTGESGRHPGDTAAGRVFTRSSSVGLHGSWGQLRLGRVPTGSFVQTLRFTPFGDSTFLGPFLMHTIVGSQPMLASHGGSDGSWSNSIVYNSPIVAGFNGHLQYGAGEGGTDGKRVDATLNYAANRFAAALSRSSITDAAYLSPRTRTDPAGAPYIMEKEESTLASASYDFGVAKVYAQVASAKLQPRGSAQIGLDTIGLNAEVPVGPGRIIAGWARTEREQAGVASRTRRTLSVGYDHHFSKRTDWYTVLIVDRATGLTSGTGFATGIRHRF